MFQRPLVTLMAELLRVCYMYARPKHWDSTCSFSNGGNERYNIHTFLESINREKLVEKPPEQHYSLLSLPNQDYMYMHVWKWIWEWDKRASSQILSVATQTCPLRTRPSWTVHSSYSSLIVRWEEASVERPHTTMSWKNYMYLPSLMKMNGELFR